ncbi:MAG: serine/threonine-protein kinase [Planctomycetes bacterium]|jgi:tetratricopeptide (TPR) repeat protein|nr:serine/threonine-protein kinase [Planctomycetota bacterium]
MSAAGGDERDPLDTLVEAFQQRRRAEPGLGVEAFAAEHPQHAEALRELLPTVLALEGIKRHRASSGSGQRKVSMPAIDRLGDFKIVRELGRGGMGVVFEAVQESLGRKVALKVLPQASLLTGNQLERFRREAQIAAQLHHSNIVPVFGSGESDGYHWYAMQYIAGQGLDRWRELQAEAPPGSSGAWRNRARFLARLGVQAAAALHYAHGQGTLHRDIKPANLLLEVNDQLWVTDFGLAKALESEGLTHSGDVLGTLQYMAPEQFSGQYDARSEVYALGVTLYELVTLRPAFAGGSRSELMERIRTQRPASLRAQCPELPEDLAVVIETAMARDPADRYATAEALRSDLQAFLDDRPIAARRLSTFGVVLRWCRRNRAMAALAASTALAVVGAGVIGWIGYASTSDALRQARAQELEKTRQSEKATGNLDLALLAFGRFFDALVGPDPLLAIDEDADTGEQVVAVRTRVEPGHVALLQEILRFYDRFAAKNADSTSLRLETARAWRRVGAIQVRLGDLVAAEKAYQQALERLAAIGTDTEREVAAVELALGQIDHQRGRIPSAEQRYRKALGLLAASPEAATAAVRYERAVLHFELARSLVPQGRTGGGPGGPGGFGGGRSGAERVRERIKVGREQLQLTLQLVEGLLAEDPAAAEPLALKARCLLFAAGPQRRRGDAGGAQAEGDRRQRETTAIEILRLLIRTHPDVASHRIELCEALLQTQARDEPGPRRSVADPAVLREAVALADSLLDEQPKFHEYRHLRARAGFELARALRDAQVADDELRTAFRREAETQLHKVAHIDSGLAAGDGALDRRFVRQFVDTRRVLAGMLDTAAQRDEAVALAREVLVLLERLVQAEQLWDGFLGERFPGAIEHRLLESVADWVEPLADAAMHEQLRQLREALPPRDGPERGDGPPERRGR